MLSRFITNITFFSDKLNIALIAIAAVLAYIFPLELFIFSYALLGPLHYVTEINWLHEKNYFFTSHKLIWLIIGVTAALILFLPKLFLYYYSEETAFTAFLIFINEWSNSVIFISLMVAIAYQFVSSKTSWIITIVLAILGALLLKNVEQYRLLIGMFVPTVIHVYLFTLIFMLYGAKKSNSRYGYISVIVALMIPVLIINLNIAPDAYLFNDLWKEAFLENDFHVLPVVLSKYLGITDGTSFFFYEPIWIKFMMFISFIYCYHYLNWFSKTTVIKWHKLLNKKKIIAICMIWLAVFTMYCFDFTLGILMSLFLGFTHVILEFPLNMLSIKEILFSNK
jgi:hypothetical protein